MSLRRTGPPARRTPLARSKTPMARKPMPARRQRLAPRSDAKVAEMAVRSADVAAAVAAGQRCELGPLITRVDPRHRCTGVPGGRHEVRKRSSGGSVTNPANLMWACNPCNQWVENYPIDAHRLGLVARPGDPDWPTLGRNDPRQPLSAPESNERTT